MWPQAAFLINGAITRPATGSITFGQPYPNYMQSFIRFCGVVLEKNANEILTLCNFTRITSVQLGIKKLYCVGGM